jgi:nitrogen fixation protein FixH
VSGRLWAWVPVLLLGSSVAFGAWRVAVILGDPSFSAEDRAYERGLAWDAELERRAAAAALGWIVTVETPAARESGELLVRVRDRAGAPVAGLRGRVEAFHNAHPRELLEAELAERAPGLLAAPAAPPRAGLWQWRLALEGEAGAWTGVVRAEVAR